MGGGGLSSAAGLLNPSLELRTEVSPKLLSLQFERLFREGSGQPLSLHDKIFDKDRTRSFLHKLPHGCHNVGIPRGVVYANSRLLAKCHPEF